MFKSIGRFLERFADDTDLIGLKIAGVMVCVVLTLLVESL